MSAKVAALQDHIAELESQLASEKTLNEQLSTGKVKADKKVAKAQDGMKTLGEELSRSLSSYHAMKKNIEALMKDLSDRNSDLEKSQKDFSKYRACHIKGAKGLCNDIIHALEFINLTPFSFSVGSCTILQFCDRVSICAQLLCKTRKMYGELTATVGV